jgi:putative ABC transport system permease protein
MKFTLLGVGFSYIRKHGLQSFLLVLGIALGVALVTSVDLANKSAALSFSLSTEAFSSSSTHRITGRNGSVDERVYVELSKLGINNAVPYVQDYVNVPEFEGRTLRLIGIDPFSSISSEQGIFNKDLPPETFSSLLTEPNTVLISEALADREGISKGDSLRIMYGSVSETVRVIGLIEPEGGGAARGLQGVIVSDISTAQELLNKTGLLTHIDLTIDDQSREGSLSLSQIQNILPEGIDIGRVDQLSKSAESMTRAFELNLLTLSLLALFVGLFLIYNAVIFSVLSRRHTFAVLRVLGVTGREIFQTVLIETVILGLIGSLLGLFLGILLGRGILGLVTSTINDLYFTLTVTGFTVSPYTIVKGLLLGVIASVIAGVVPAYEASRVKPAGALSRSTLESFVLKSLKPLSFIGAGFIAAGLILIYLPSDSLSLGLISIFFILLGSSLLVPLITRILMKLFSHIGGYIDIIAQMAPRNVVRSLSRTGVAIASLTVAVSVILSVGIMIGSFRVTVVSWLDNTLNADIFISAVSQNVSSNTGLDPAIYSQVARFPGIDKVATARRIRLSSPEYGAFNLLAVTEDIASYNKKFIWSGPEPSKIWEKLLKDSVLISESFAYRNGIEHGYGNTVMLLTDKGVREFKVAGIYFDYSYQTGVVLMSDTLYRSLWDDTLINSLAANVVLEEDSEEIAQRLTNEFSQKYNVYVRSNQALKESALNTFDRTFKVTGALRTLVVVVAFIGVLSSLMALQLGRVREFGVLRAIGMTVTQLRKMTFLENALIGTTAGLLSIPVGLLLSYLLIYVVNLRSFGWTVDLVLQPRFLIEGLSVSIIAALAAGIYPALVIDRENIANLLREE